MNWLNDWLTVTDWPTDWQTETLIWLTDLLTDWLPPPWNWWSIVWLIKWLSDWRPACQTDWLVKFYGWRTDWLADWLIDWLRYRLADRWIDWLSHWSSAEDILILIGLQMDNWTNRLTDNHVSQKQRVTDRQTDRQNSLDKQPDWQTKLHTLFSLQFSREPLFIHVILVEYIAWLTYQTQSNLSKGLLCVKQHLESDIQVSELPCAAKLLNCHKQSIGFARGQEVTCGWFDCICCNCKPWSYVFQNIYLVSAPV